MKASKNHNRGSCSSVLLVIVALLLVVGALVLGAYALRQWITTQPRTNVLILGLDRRPEQSVAVRSDTMILMTAHPSLPQIAFLSIPRDLYVDIPGHETNRINTAHFWGENASAGGGPTLAMQTVAQNLGIPLNRYVRVDFSGFRAIVDAAGGIDVVVEEPIIDNAYPSEDYGTIRIEIPAGPQHMDGETALQYARSRHGTSDFDRAERQQLILAALGRQLLRPETLPYMPAIYVALKNNVDTNLTLKDMAVIAWALYETGPEGIESYIIEREMTQPWTTPSGSAVLLPRWEAILPLAQELFAP